VIIPTDVNEIAEGAFGQCAGGNELEAVIITT
jgi:hypothetical protein